MNCIYTGDQFHIRWFTPTNEVALCGHATLATAAVLFNELGNFSSLLKFKLSFLIEFS
jgi:predicted PhzF superfamily epimerase YddE/YHI9